MINIINIISKFMYIFLNMYAIMFKKKARWSFLTHTIDIKIYNNAELVLVNRDIECKYIIDNLLEYKDDYGIHIINLIDNIYKKSSNTEQMIIDFNKNNCQIKTSDGYELSFDIKSNIEKNKDKIVLEYIFDKEQIRIIIDMKE